MGRGARQAAEEAVATEHDEVTELGGLYVLGTERHESRRIDNQLRGRSGRQGDPGESRFYLSLQDDLMRLFNAAMVDRFMTTAKMEDEVPIESKMVSRSIQSAQSQVEAQQLRDPQERPQVRRRPQPPAPGHLRRAPPRCSRARTCTSRSATSSTTSSSGYVDAATADGFAGRLGPRAALDRDEDPLPGLDHHRGGRGGRRPATRSAPDLLREQLTSDAHHAYDEREEALGAEVMREVERRVVLSVLDRKWREHLYEMDYLQEGIGLRAMAQRDPLVEYQREGFQLFEAMMEAIKEESVGYLFNVEVQVEPPADAIAGQALEPMSVSDMIGALAATPQDAVADDSAAEPADQVQDREVAATSNGSNGSTREPVPTGARVPPAFSAKGLGGPAARQLRYTAPSDDGSVEERSVSEEAASGAGSNGAPQTRAGNRPPKRSSKKARRRGK